MQSVEELLLASKIFAKQIWVKKGTDEVIEDDKLSAYSKDDIEQITQNALNFRKKKVWVKKGTDEVIEGDEISAYPKEAIQQITQGALNKRKKKVWVKKGTDEVIEDDKISAYPKDAIQQITQNALNSRKKKVWVKKGTDEVIEDDKLSSYPKEALQQITQKALNRRKKKVWVRKGTDEIIEDDKISAYPKKALQQINQYELNRRKKKVWVRKGTDEVIEDDKISSYPKEALQQITQKALNRRKKKVWVRKGTDEVIEDDKISAYPKEAMQQITQGALKHRKKKVWVKKGTDEVIEDDKISAYPKNSIEKITPKVLHQRQTRQNKKRHLEPEQTPPKRQKSRYEVDVWSDNNKEDGNKFYEGISFSALAEDHKFNSEPLIDAISSSYLSVTQTLANSTCTPIKQEPAAVNLPAVMEKLRNILVDKREGNNCLDNCGHITQYTLLTLENLLQGKAPPTDEISTETSGIDTTATQITYGYFHLKDENGKKVKKQLRTVSAAALPTMRGLHSLLPPKVVPYIFLDTSSPEALIIDLEADKIPATPTTIKKVNDDLKREAFKAGGIIIGQLAFFKLGKKKRGHVVNFCASEQEIFFIDGQLVDGTNKDHPGDPVFTSLVDNINYEFATSFDLAPSNEAFGDNCFYLVHKAIPNTFFANKDSTNSLLTTSLTTFFKLREAGPSAETIYIEDMELETLVDSRQKSFF